MRELSAVLVAMLAACFHVPVSSCSALGSEGSARLQQHPGAACRAAFALSGPALRWARASQDCSPRAPACARISYATTGKGETRLLASRAGLSTRGRVCSPLQLQAKASGVRRVGMAAVQLLLVLAVAVTPMAPSVAQVGIPSDPNFLYNAKAVSGGSVSSVLFPTTTVTVCVCVIANVQGL